MTNIKNKIVSHPDLQCSTFKIKLKVIRGQFNKGHLLKGHFRKKPYSVEKSQKQHRKSSLEQCFEMSTLI